MGKGNAAVKQWLGNPRRFADLFNGIVFQGKQVILPEDLHPATGETDILVSDKNEKAKEVQRYRDIIMRWEQGGISGTVGVGKSRECTLCHDCEKYVV